MRLTRIYQPQPLCTDDLINLSKAAAHHLVGVLRATVGSEFTLFNGEGGEFLAKIVSIEKNSVSVQVGEYSQITRESPLQIVLGQAISRPERMDYTLQKAVELGVTRIVPLLVEHSCIKLSMERWKKRLLHWQAVVLAACEQSGRTQIPSVSQPIPLVVAVNEIKADIRAILIPTAVQAISKLKSSAPRVVIFVGPEGGWSKTEISLAIAAGCVPICLGPRILRTETAGLVAITLFQGAFGDISLNLV